jgi:primary-amine oxidase
MIDGLRNSISEVDVVVDEEDVGSKENFYGNGFKTVKKPFKTSKGSISNYNSTTSRSWLIENPNKPHYSTGGNVGYKIGMFPLLPVILSS